MSPTDRTVTVTRLTPVLRSGGRTRHDGKGSDPCGGLETPESHEHTLHPTNTGRRTRGRPDHIKLKCPPRASVPFPGPHGATGRVPQPTGVGTPGQTSTVDRVPSTLLGLRTPLHLRGWDGTSGWGSPELSGRPLLENPLSDSYPVRNQRRSLVNFTSLLRPPRSQGVGGRVREDPRPRGTPKPLSPPDGRVTPPVSPEILPLDPPL